MGKGSLLIGGNISLGITSFAAFLTMKTTKQRWDPNTRSPSAPSRGSRARAPRVSPVHHVQLFNRQDRVKTKVDEMNVYDIFALTQYIQTLTSTS